MKSNKTKTSQSAKEKFLSLFKDNTSKPKQKKKQPLDPHIQKFYKPQEGCFDEDRIIDNGFGQNTIKNSICMICSYHVAKDPVQCQECRKIFGYNCVKDFLECPVCRYPFRPQGQDSNNHLRNIFIRDALSDFLRIKCINAPNGCDAQLPLNEKEIEYHEQQCQYTIVNCQNSLLGCEWSSVSKSLGTHLDKECLYREVSCAYKQHGCQWRDYYLLLELHQNEECQYKIVGCQNQQNGCKWQDCIYKYQAHFNECQYQIMNCQYLTLGCQWQGIRKDKEQHEKKECNNRPIHCPNLDKNCTWKGQFQDLHTHLTEKCLHRIVKCPGNKDKNLCSWEGPLSSLDKHQKRDCDFRMLPCPYKKEGCQAPIMAYQVEEHLNDYCLYVPIECYDCKINKQDIYEFRRPEYEQHIQTCDFQFIETCQYCENECYKIQHEKHENNCNYNMQQCEICEKTFTKYGYKKHQFKVCYSDKIQIDDYLQKVLQKAQNSIDALKQQNNNLTQQNKQKQKCERQLKLEINKLKQQNLEMSIAQFELEEQVPYEQKKKNMQIIAEKKNNLSQDCNLNLL